MKAVSYLRVSGKGQIDGDGFPRQREAVTGYAKRNRLKIEAEFRDEGVTGTAELEDRVGLADLLSFIEAEKITTVLVEKSDRLARDLMVGEVILQQFREIGVSVIDASSGTELTVSDGDPTKTLIRQILGAVAEFDKSVTVLKLRAARKRKKRATGRCEGRKPYGFHPGEDEVLERMKTLRKSLMSHSEIALTLTESGYTNRAGAPWKAERVRRILTK